MQQKSNNHQKQSQQGHPLPGEISAEQKVQNKNAQDEAMHDIDGDPDMHGRTPKDDLDEGETARLGEDKPDLV